MRADAGLAAAGQVDMAVDQARHRGAARRGLDARGAVRPAEIGAPSGGEDALALDQDRGMFQRCRAAAVDQAVDLDQPAAGRHATSPSRPMPRATPQCAVMQVCASLRLCRTTTIALRDAAVAQSGAAKIRYKYSPVLGRVDGFHHHEPARETDDG
jgi:hypothetical protein